jgi:hypothetical protein
MGRSIAQAFRSYIPKWPLVPSFKFFLIALSQTKLMGLDPDISEESN